MTTPTPEYTAEQVEAAKAELTDIAGWNGYLPLSNSIRTILSALSTAESEITRLTLQVESAEADRKRLDWLERTEHGALNWGETGSPAWSIESDSTMISGAIGDGNTLREAIDDAMAEFAARNQEGGSNA